MRSLRLGNRTQVLRLLQVHGSLHRAEIARRVGVSRSTISTIVNELLAEGLVVESTEVSEPARPQGNGRPGSLLTLNAKAGVAVGVDISYRRLHVVVADLAHNILARPTAGLDPLQGAGAALDTAVTLVRQALSDAGLRANRVLGVGLGVPGPVDRATSTVGLSSNSEGWVGVPAADELARRLKLPVVCDNTGHLGCLGELRWGAGAGCRNLIYVKLAVGVGCGLVFNGEIFHGATGVAGELGHVSIEEDGPACRCGNRGCLEAYVGLPAVLSALAPVLGENATAADVVAAARDGNRACLRVLDDTGRVLGRSLAGISNLLNPERIVIGGELAAAGDKLLTPVRVALHRCALPTVAEGLEVTAGQLGDSAGAMGGVALVLQGNRELATDTPPWPAEAARPADPPDLVER